MAMLIAYFLRTSTCCTGPMKTEVWAAYAAAGRTVHRHTHFGTFAQEIAPPSNTLTYFLADVASKEVVVIDPVAECVEHFGFFCLFFVEMTRFNSVGTHAPLLACPRDISVIACRGTCFR
jgi:hypothetical protein